MGEANDDSRISGNTIEGSLVIRSPGYPIPQKLRGRIWFAIGAVLGQHKSVGPSFLITGNRVTGIIKTEYGIKRK